MIRHNCTKYGGNFEFIEAGGKIEKIRCRECKRIWIWEEK